MKVGFRSVAYAGYANLINNSRITRSMFKSSFKAYTRPFNSKLFLSVISLTTAATIAMTYQRSSLSNESRRQARIIFLDEDEEEEEEERENKMQKAILEKPPLSSIFNIDDFEAIARTILPLSVWGYYSTGAEDQTTLSENRKAFSRIFFCPRVLIDTTSTSLETEQFGIKFDAPFYISAFAGSRGGHPDAELTLIRGAYKGAIPHMIPTRLAALPFDQFVREEVKEDQAAFYQIYFDSRKQVEEFPNVLNDIEQNYKSIKAIFITVDSSTTGNREVDYRSRYLLENSVETGIDALTYNTVTNRNKVTWDDVVKFQRSTSLPIVLKGVQSKEDVLKAIELGLGGVVISNHGGRQIDYAKSSIEVLAETNQLLKDKNIDITKHTLTSSKENKKSVKFEIFIDSGIRRGSDIIKALCLGATGVGLGRPFLYAMSSYGQPGVERAINILKIEMERDMKLLGVKNISDLNESYVDIADLKYRNRR